MTAPRMLADTAVTWDSYRPWRDKEHLRDCYVNRGWSIAEIADAMDTTYPTVHKWLERFDIERRSYGEHQTPQPLKDAAWLRTQHHELNRSITVIAEDIGCSVGTVSSALDRHDIEKRRRREVNADAKRVLRSSDLLKEAYIEQGLSANDIAEQLGCSFATVWFWLDKHGIETRDPGGPSGEDHYAWVDGVTTDYGSSWNEQRERRLEKDDYTCRRCGVTQEEHMDVYGYELDIHHIRPARTFDNIDEAHELTNLITLCRRCHRALEGMPIDNGE